MEKIELIRQWLDVPSTDPDDARRRVLLNILLVGLAFGIGAFFGKVARQSFHSPFHDEQIGKDKLKVQGRQVAARVHRSVGMGHLFILKGAHHV